MQNVIIVVVAIQIVVEAVYIKSLSAKMIPSPQVAEAFRQSNPNLSGFNSQTSIRAEFFSQRTNCLMGSSSHL
jgi:hypothetical protein